MDLQMGGGLSLDKWPNYSYSPTAIEELHPMFCGRNQKNNTVGNRKPPH